MPQGLPAEIGYFHTLPPGSRVCRYDTFSDKCLLTRVFASYDSFAKLLSDGNFVEGWAGADHGDTGERHRCQGSFMEPDSEIVVVLKRGNALGNYLRFGISCTGSSLVFLNEQENLGELMSEAQIGPHSSTCVTTYCEWNGNDTPKDGARFLKAKLKEKIFGKAINSSFAWILC